MVDMLPGVYVTQPQVPLASAKDFQGKPLTRETCLAAQAAVDGLRDHARRLRQWTTLWDEGVNVRAYYGESGQALANAEEIKALINGNLFRMTPYQFTRADLERLAIR